MWMPLMQCDAGRADSDSPSLAGLAMVALQSSLTLDVLFEATKKHG